MFTLHPWCDLYITTISPVQLAPKGTKYALCDYHALYWYDASKNRIYASKYRRRGKKYVRRWEHVKMPGVFTNRLKNIRWIMGYE